MAAKGSIILKLLVLVFIAALVMVIYIPGKLWKQESRLENTSHNNMVSIYEAEEYYHTKTKSFVPADSLEKLLAFIKSDSTLIKKQKIGQLTNVLYDSVQKILTVPVIKAIIPISNALSEIDGDLSFNARYFEKYENIAAEAKNINASVNKFANNPDFPAFNHVRVYIDSLSILSDRVNEYKLQNAAQFAQQYIDSISSYLSNMELNKVQSEWAENYNKINSFVKDVKKTDIVLVSSVADRLKKFIDRINTSMSDLEKINPRQDVALLNRYKSAVSRVYSMFINPENFLVSQNDGILQLDEKDSILVKLSESNFYDPDTIDGVQRYFVAYDGTNLVVESPNLSGMFHSDLETAVQPIQNLSFFSGINNLRASLDSTINEMNAAKDKYRLSRYSTELLLDLKEVIAEMKDLNNIRFYRYANNIKNFVDTVKTERRLSVLKPLIEEILNPMDTLATHIETRNISDLEDRMNYFGEKLKKLDSLVAENPKMSSRTKRQIPSFYGMIETATHDVHDLKSALNPADGAKLRAAGKEIESALLKALNGYKEKVYMVFSKKHINHGYVENGEKSWESE